MKNLQQFIIVTRITKKPHSIATAATTRVLYSYNETLEKKIQILHYFSLKLHDFQLIIILYKKNSCTTEFEAKKIRRKKLYTDKIQKQTFRD
jgi:hypothetical protein